MTDARQYRVTYSQRSLLKIMTALGTQAEKERAVGDLQEASYLRYLRALLMRGVLEDDPADSK